MMAMMPLLTDDISKHTKLRSALLLLRPISCSLDMPSLRPLINKLALKNYFN
jgi:hypothetical protein